MIGVLRWAMRSHPGFLNYIKRGGTQKRLPPSVVFQTPGHAGRAYEGQNPQSHLLWAFFG